MPIDLFGGGAARSQPQPAASSQPIDLFGSDSQPQPEESLVDKIKSMIPEAQYPLALNVATKIGSMMAPRGMSEAITSLPYAARGSAPSATESAEMGIADQIPELALTSAAPPMRLGRLLPGLGNMGKGLLNYGTDIVQNAGIMAGANALEGKSPVEGAVAGGAGTALINPLVQAFGSGNPLIRLAGAGLLGAGATYAGQQALGTNSLTADAAGGLLGASLGLRGKNAKNLAIMNLLKDVDMSRAAPRLDKAERMGLPFYRPSEAMDSGYIGGIEGSVGHTPEAALFLEKKTEERQAAEKGYITKLYDKVFDAKKMTPQVDALYKASYQSKVSPQFLDNLKQSAIVKEAMKRVDTNPVYQDVLQGVPEHSFAYLDQVKRAMDAMAEEAPRSEASVINGVKNNMLKRMDKINGSYKQARALAERGIVRREKLDLVNDEALKGSSFYKKVLVNDDKFEELVNGVRNAPGAQQQLRDARDVFRTIVDSNKSTARAGVVKQLTSMSSPRSSWQAFLHKLQGGEYDMEMSKLMTDPKWRTKVKRAKEMAKPNEKMRYIANLISRIGEKKLSDVISPVN